MAFNKKFNARNPLNYGKASGKGAAYSSVKRSPLGYSPFKQVEGETNTNVGLLSSEDPDTYVYKGTDLHERIIDLEERISFIQEDIWNIQEGPADAPVDESQGTDQQIQDLATLRTELTEVRVELDESGQKSNIKPGYNEEGQRDPSLDLPSEPY